MSKIFSLELSVPQIYVNNNVIINFHLLAFSLENFVFNLKQSLLYLVLTLFSKWHILFNRLLFPPKMGALTFCTFKDMGQTTSYLDLSIFEEEHVKKHQNIFLKL